MFVNSPTIDSIQIPTNLYSNKVLFTTGHLFLISFIVFLLYSDKNVNECILGLCLVLTYICAALFWYNPIQHSRMHKIDAIVAKVSIVSFLLYTFFMKKLSCYVYYSYCLLFLGMIVTAYLSQYYSSQQWCSDNHIVSHGLLHTFCFLGSFYAFL